MFEKISRKSITTEHNFYNVAGILSSTFKKLHSNVDISLKNSENVRKRFPVTTYGGVRMVSPFHHRYFPGIFHYYLMKKFSIEYQYYVEHYVVIMNFPLGYWEVKNYFPEPWLLRNFHW